MLNVWYNQPKPRHNKTMFMSDGSYHTCLCKKLLHVLLKESTPLVADALLLGGLLSGPCLRCRQEQYLCTAHNAQFMVIGETSWATFTNFTIARHRHSCLMNNYIRLVYSHIEPKTNGRFLQLILIAFVKCGCMYLYPRYTKICSRRSIDKKLSSVQIMPWRQSSHNPLN